MIELADSHGHLTMVFPGPEARWPTREATDAEVGELVARARDAGVTRVLVPATTLEDAPRAVEVAERFDGVFAAVGVHPHETKGFDEDRVIRALERLAASSKVVAIGDVFRFNEKALKRKASEWDALGCGESRGETDNCVYKMKSLSSEKMPAREEAARNLHSMVLKYAAPAPGLKVTDASGRHVLGVEYRYATIKGKRVAYVFNALDKDVALKIGDHRDAWKITADMIDGKPVPAKLKLQPLGLVMFTY